MESRDEKIVTLTIGSGHTFGGCGSNPDRWRRLLEGAHRNRRRGYLHVATAVGEDSLLWSLQQNVQAFRKDGRRLIYIDAEAVELELLVSRTNAEFESTVGNDVDKADFRQQALWLVERQHADCGSEPNGARQSGTVGYHQ